MMFDDDDEMPPTRVFEDNGEMPPTRAEYNERMRYATRNLTDARSGRTRRKSGPIRQYRTSHFESRLV